jgi:hypothetical protein
MNHRNIVRTTCIASVACAAALIVFSAFTGARPAAAAQETRTAATHWPESGKKATVHFRRDYLAGEPFLPLSPIVDSTRGQEIAVSGTLRDVNDNFVVLEGPRSMYYIPRKNVLVLEVAR